jgi:hypothetical protein
MLQSTRRILAALSVAATLLLVVPAPSRAAQAHKPAPEHTLGLMAQVWSWLESLLGGPSSQAGVPRKTVMTSPAGTTPTSPPPDQGPLIDPNGQK